MHRNFMEFMGGFFFLGIFVGFLFLMATVLTIYYKQISEGYDEQRAVSDHAESGNEQKRSEDLIRS